MPRMNGVVYLEFNDDNFTIAQLNRARIVSVFEFRDKEGRSRVLVASKEVNKGSLRAIVKKLGS